MKIIVVSAVDFEVKAAKEKIAQQKNVHEIIFKTTGIGLMSAAVMLTQTVLEEKPDLIIQAGIAGSFDESLLNKTVMVKEEIIGDLGVEENNEWKNIFEMKLEDANKFPFENGRLVNDKLAQWNVLSLPEATGISVNEISTGSKRIEILKAKYNAAIESMEGAALHFVCRKFGVNFIQLRTVSNLVGERDKTKWMMKEAVENLNEMLVELISRLVN